MEAPIGEHASDRLRLYMHADRERRLAPTQRDQRAIEREHRAPVRALNLHVDLAVIAREREPRITFGEARVLARVPLHRRALWIAAEAEARHVFLPRVAHALYRNRHVGHADFLALIDRRCAA